jgi:hypothetical protein
LTLFLTIQAPFPDPALALRDPYVIAFGKLAGESGKAPSTIKQRAL